MELILWGIIVILAVVNQYYLIEVKKLYPNKLTWFGIRILIALGFLFWYNSLGYLWYWSLVFMAGTFWLPFNEGLNLLRKKPFGYLSSKNSLFDRLIIKHLPGGATAYVVYASILLVYSIAQMILYGKLTWTQLNTL